MVGGSRPDWRAAIIDASEFSAEQWIEIGGTTNLGTISGEWKTDEVTTPNPEDPDGAPVPQYQKVMRPAKAMQIRTDFEASDAGQIRMLQAEQDVDPYAFRIVFPDGSERLFIALVVGADDQMDEANNAVGLLFSLVLQSNVVRQWP